MKITNWIISSMMIVFVAGSVGCGQGFKSVGSGTGLDKASSVDVSDAMQKAEQASLSAQQAMAEADEALKTVQDDKGNINISLFTRSSTSDVQTQFILNGVIEKLRGVFDKVFAKVQLVKDQFALARAKLAEAMSKLDPNNPAHALMIAKINEQLAKIDALETKFSSSMHMLAGKLDLAVSALDRVITGVTSFIPGWGSLVGLALDYFVMSDVKALIMELKMKLLAI